eukprot:c8653_g1_i1.p1 GENE.c8653_g1_i1~~c8653_g1_i1.p1  ORF type:complete len:604 (+),score=238.54 c8653_g1_i1:1-1812(+)
MGNKKKKRRKNMKQEAILFVSFLLCFITLGAPLQPEAVSTTTIKLEEPQKSVVQNVDLGLTVFDHNSASSVDQSKHYVILAFDTESCSGAKSETCKKLENLMGEAFSKKLVESPKYKKFESHVVFGKANKDDFPEHKQDFEKAKVPLPAILFWPAGHSRPSCKFDTVDAPTDQFTGWLIDKLKEEDDESLIELEEGTSDNNNKKVEKLDDVSFLVCQADGGPNVVAKEDLSCGDLLAEPTLPLQGLVELEKTQKIWSFKEKKTKFIGPADNSLPHQTNGIVDGEVKSLDSASYHELSKQNKWVALYFHAPWCHYCECIDPVWKSVSGNLISSQRQPNLVLGEVNGDANVELRTLFNVTVYPTFVLVNKQGNTVLGRYLGPRKAFELSSWIEDLIVGAENPIVKHEFEQSEQGKSIDMNPVYPYSGPSAYVADKVPSSQALASVEVSLTGNDFDECLESDERKFTAPGAALLVHYSSDPSVKGRSLEFDGHSLNTETVPTKLTVVDFFAPWCPHCQKLNPVWDSLSSEMASKEVVVGKVDVETHGDVKKQFGIRRFPTIMYFPAGQKMTFDENRRYKGQRDVEHLKQWIEEVSRAPAQQAQPQK